MRPALKCSQIGCGADAGWRYTWPGRASQGICSDHRGKLEHTAQSMGLQLELEPMPRRELLELLELLERAPATAHERFPLTDAAAFGHLSATVALCMRDLRALLLLEREGWIAVRPDKERSTPLALPEAPSRSQAGALEILPAILPEREEEIRQAVSANAFLVGGTGTRTTVGSARLHALERDEVLCLVAWLCTIADLDVGELAHAVVAVHSS